MIPALRRPWLAFERLLLPSLPATRLGAVRALVCLVALYDVMLYSGLVFPDAAAVTSGEGVRPWTPLFYFQVLGVQPIDTDTAVIAYRVAVVSLLMGALGIFSRWSCAVGALAFFYWTGLAYSFGKPHHDKVALAFAMASLPFAKVGAGLSIDAWVRARFGRKPPREHYARAMPVRMLQATLVVGYCGAGFAKIILGGLDWFNGYTLQGIMLGHNSYLSWEVGASPLLCQLQSIGVVAVQSCFLLVILWHPARWFFLPMATFFHLMTWMTMDTGPYMRVWILLWVFVPVEQVPEWLRQRLTGPVGTAVLVGVLVLGYATLVGGVAARAVPVWALATLGAVMLLAFVRYCAVHGWNRGAIADTTRPQ